MENKIQLRFKLENLQKVGFAADFGQQDIVEWLLALQKDGIEVNADFYDDLCRSTINNGHNLLRSREIFNIESSVIGPMARVIGEHLFRLLFGTKNFIELLHLARRQKKELEIILEFDYAKDDSKRIMNLPWELMYCPESLSPDDEEDKEDGFFVSQAASIYRKYKNETDSGSSDKREVHVSVAFLTKDIENLDRTCKNYISESKNVMEANSNLHFLFPNFKKETNSVNLLSVEDLSNIFLHDVASDSKNPINKIVHLVCDVSVIESKDKTGMNIYEKALFFNKTGNETEPIGFQDVFKVLFNKDILQDQSIKLLVLQAWNDEKNYAYSGFEELANKMIKKNQTAILSMPYIMNRKSADGSIVFFQTLYGGIATEQTLIDVVQQLRNKIFPNYSYGFPIFYLNGANETLVTKANLSDDSRKAAVDKKNAEKIRASLARQESKLLEKKHFFEEKKISNSDPGAAFSIETTLNETNKALEEVEKKKTVLSSRTND